MVQTVWEGVRAADSIPDARDWARGWGGGRRLSGLGEDVLGQGLGDLRTNGVGDTAQSKWSPCGGGITEAEFVLGFCVANSEVDAAGSIEIFGLLFVGSGVDDTLSDGVVTISTGLALSLLTALAVLLPFLLHGMTTVGVLSAALWPLLIVTVFSEVNCTETMAKANGLGFFSEGIGVNGGDRASSK